MGNMGKVASCYAKMASIELTGKDYTKVQDYVAKAVAAAGDDTKAGGEALGVLVEMALAQDDYWKAISKVRELVAYYHNAGDSKMEATALLQYGGILLDKGDSAKA